MFAQFSAVLTGFLAMGKLLSCGTNLPVSLHQVLQENPGSQPWALQLDNWETSPFIDRFRNHSIASRAARMPEQQRCDDSQGCWCQKTTLDVLIQYDK